MGRLKVRTGDYILFFKIELFAEKQRFSFERELLVLKFTFHKDINSILNNIKLIKISLRTVTRTQRCDWKSLEHKNNSLKIYDTPSCS